LSSVAQMGQIVVKKTSFQFSYFKRQKPVNSTWISLFLRQNVTTWLMANNLL